MSRLPLGLIEALMFMLLLFDGEVVFESIFLEHMAVMNIVDALLVLDIQI